MGGDHLWDAIGAIGEIVGAIAVLTSLLYLAVQIRQNTASMKSSTFQNAVTSISEVSLGIGTDEDTAGITYTAFTQGISALTDAQRFRFGLLMTGLFRNYENFWFHYENGVMEEHMWQGVRNAMLGYLEHPSVKIWWGERSSIFSPKFVAYIESQDQLQARSDQL